MRRLMVFFLKATFDDSFEPKHTKPMNIAHNLPNKPGGTQGKQPGRVGGGEVHKLRRHTRKITDWGRLPRSVAGLFIYLLACLCSRLSVCLRWARHLKGNFPCALVGLTGGNNQGPACSVPREAPRGHPASPAKPQEIRRGVGWGKVAAGPRGAATASADCPGGHA